MSLMMTMTNPITPPPELVEQWSDIKPMENAVVQNWVKIATQAAQWGANKELEAMLAELKALHLPDGYAARLRDARRPKPPSLKGQALEALQFVDEKLDLPLHNHCNAIHTIRRALESLND
jgi:hypothetical protein